MTKLKVAVQMDSPKVLNKETDSTLAIIEAAIKKKYTVFIYTVDNLSLKDGLPAAYCKKVINIDIKKNNFLQLSNIQKKKLSDFNVILIRQDPPFNMNYLTATYFLEKIKKKTIILNDPVAIRNSPEKLLVTNFYQLMPPTLITKNRSDIDSFLKKHKEFIIKPLYGNGGKNVFYSSLKDPNLPVILEKFLEDTEHFILQKFIKNILKGDKRILLINGEPVGAVNRLPSKNQVRANLHIGAKAKKTTLTKRDIQICKIIKKTLNEKNIFFAGIDVIDRYLTEINITSPTCIREIDYFNKDNIATKFWNTFEKKYL